MKWARWDSARHSLTIVADGATTRVRADLSPSFSVQLTPPQSLANVNGRVWSDSAGRVWSDSTDREWTA